MFHTLNRGCPTIRSHELDEDDDWYKVIRTPALSTWAHCVDHVTCVDPDISSHYCVREDCRLINKLQS
jgi:hypothetical protein